MTVLEKIFTSFRDSDFTSLEKPGELSFLDLGAAPGGFTEFLLNYERQDCKGRDGKPLPVSVKRGHAITLAVEAGGAKLKLPRLTKGGSYTFQYKDIYDLRAADIECPDVDIVVADADAETAASMNESASQTSSHVYTNYGVRRADSKTTQSVVSSLRQWQLLFKQVALGLAKLKPGGLFIFRFARAIVSDDSASPGASGSTSKPPTVFERDVHFQLCFWFLQSILSLFRGVEPHNRRDDACYIAVHSFKRSQFQSEQWTARLERVCESLAGVKTENELKAQLELAKVSQFATWTLTPLAMERRPHVEKFLNHIKPTELAPMSALPWYGSLPAMPAAPSSGTSTSSSSATSAAAQEPGTGHQAAKPDRTSVASNASSKMPPSIRGVEPASANNIFRPAPAEVMATGAAATAATATTTQTANVLRQPSPTSARLRGQVGPNGSSSQLPARNPSPFQRGRSPRAANAIPAAPLSGTGAVASSLIRRPSADPATRGSRQPSVDASARRQPSVDRAGRGPSAENKRLPLHEPRRRGPSAERFARAGSANRNAGSRFGSAERRQPSAERRPSSSERKASALGSSSASTGGTQTRSNPGTNAAVVRSQQASVTLQRRFSDDKRIDTGAGPGNDVPRREAMAAPTSLNASAMLPGPSATTTDRGSAAAAKVSTSLMNESQVSSRVSAGLSALRERSAERLRLLERQRQELDRSLSRVRESSVTRANAADDAASAAPAGDTRQQFAQASGAGIAPVGAAAAVPRRARESEDSELDAGLGPGRVRERSNDPAQQHAGQRQVTLPRHGTGVIRKGSVERAKRIFENKEHSFGSVRRREEDLQDQGSLERQSSTIVLLGEGGQSAGSSAAPARRTPIIGAEAARGNIFTSGSRASGSKMTTPAQGGAYKSPHSALLETTHRTPEQTKGSALPAGATSSTRRAGLEQYKTPHTSVATKATPKGGAEKDTEALSPPGRLTLRDVNKLPSPSKSPAKTNRGSASPKKKKEVAEHDTKPKFTITEDDPQANARSIADEVLERARLRHKRDAELGAARGAPSDSSLTASSTSSPSPNKPQSAASGTTHAAMPRFLSLASTKNGASTSPKPPLKLRHYLPSCGCILVFTACFAFLAVLALLRFVLVLDTEMSAALNGTGGGSPQLTVSLPPEYAIYFESDKFKPSSNMLLLSIPGDYAELVTSSRDQYRALETDILRTAEKVAADLVKTMAQLGENASTFVETQWVEVVEKKAYPAWEVLVTEYVSPTWDRVWTKVEEGMASTLSKMDEKR
mmetsp:Transcript_13846/g.34140  ORF Transcript_13846/g.34140 Transcript_13846/m.34140 type:complete len:1274 (+) Transcript_13846:234-4055(+)|eukprot:CAMPEP_0178987986 /NCGR_PEP_ID=MMETSP0795-20121207/3569_1 /TAXON_ID=88552 /ORGANISM="Amoebophrya sp., Strain Ameob2" /LENGTH=1273 /DNA_ID=CAMNT_0020679229 /DNA_START=154 /DNA_END=3975 /DNA_ORIENTATION=+